ncbi:MAG: AbrB/MazE/SpoVT family DNA-binding domain-containing protein [Deltaproteobacteria bacterium]|nr:AbrB/MazE/SpoVT family DNA-binding domain-containing protein [Deltaproteobacteria bacterium]
MRKTLIQHGNSAALIIDKPILELLKITPETPLELSTDGDKLIVAPIRGEVRPATMEAYKKVAAKHRKTLARLAK